MMKDVHFGKKTLSSAPLRLCVNSFFILFLLFSAGTLQAQQNTNTATDPDNSNSFSPTNTSTSGRFKTAIDDYISPQDYTSLKLNSWFGYASWATLGQPQLGFAKQINNVYLAFYYKGTLWGGLNNFASKEEIVPTFMGGTAGKKLTTYTIPAPLDYPDNSAAILVGFADMGIRLGFSSTYDSFTSDGNMRVESGVNTYNYYKSYELENGNLVPQIKWAMARDILERRGIRPYATVTLNFHRENLKADQYTAPDKTSGDKILYSQNYFQPSLAVGLGGFVLYNENDFKVSVDLDYVLRFTMYSNDYSYAVDTSTGLNPDDYVYGIKTIEGTWGPSSSTNPNLILREKSNMFNSIVPSVSGSWSLGNLGIKAKLRVNLDFDNATSTDMDVIHDASGKTSGDLQKQGNDETKDTFTVTPRLDLGLQYMIIPDKLTLNVGGRLARSIAYTTTSVRVFDTDGKEDGTGASNSKSTNFGDLTWRLYAGTMFNLTENVWLEAVTGVQNGVNVFSTSSVDGLFNFTSIAVGIRF